MKTEVAIIQHTLQELLRAHTPLLQIRVQTDTNFEVAGTKPGMQGKQKVDGYYFATVMPKAKDCRLYFFPLYTHTDAFDLAVASSPLSVSTHQLATGNRQLATGNRQNSEAPIA